MTKRVYVTLPDLIFRDLEQWAKQEGRPIANLAAYLLEQQTRRKFPDRYADQEKDSEKSELRNE